MSNPLKKSEIVWGTAYAIFQFFLLGMIALILNLFLQLPEWQLQVGIFLLNFLVTLIIFRKFLLGSCKTALQKPLRILGFTLLGFVHYYIGAILVGAVIMSVRPDYFNLNDAAISQMAQESGIWMAVGAVLFVPVAEECIFRGLCFRAIYDRCPALAWIISVGLFSVVHIIGYIGLYDPVKLLLAFLQYLPAGISLAFAYKESDTIVTPILIHTSINLIGMLLQ